MPTYKIKDPQSGKTIRITGDSPPTEQELNQIFASTGGSPTPPQQPASKAPAYMPQQAIAGSCLLAGRHWLRIM